MHAIFMQFSCNFHAIFMQFYVTLLDIPSFMQPALTVPVVSDKFQVTSFLQNFVRVRIHEGL